MPGTAASNLQSRAHAKARPSANARAASLVANTPVLFRLPLIPNAPTQELPATFADTTAGLPTAQLSAVTAGAVTAGASVVAASQASASAASPQTEATAHAVPTRTWWEHWSSGIVLIVLLIALATASILAWQGGGKSNEKLLADTETSSEKPFESLSDLSSIEVPKLGESKLSTATPAAEVLTLPALKSSPATNSQASLQNNSMQPETANEDTNGSDAEDASSLIPSGPMGLSFDAPTESTKLASKPEATLTPESHATASLQSPVVKPQEPLFKDEPTATRSSVSAQPASTPSTMNSGAMNSGAPKSTATGGSPAMWDSSSLNPTDKPSTSGQGLSLELSSPTKPASDSNTLGAATKPEATTTTPALLTSQPASTPASTTSTTIQPTPSATGPAIPSNINYAGKTSTPELDRAALIATFRQYSSTDMTAPPIDATANRYRAPATSTPGLQSPSSPAGTAASMVGFTQQPAQHQTQQQFTQQPTQQPNYALQPNQQNQPQQNQTLQYPTQQFQNQYAPQGQQPLYQQQQFQPQQTQQAPAQQSFNQQMPFGTQPTTAPQFTAPNANLNNIGLINNGTTANTSNGYYIPPTAPTNSQPNSLSYPSLR